MPTDANVVFLTVGNVFTLLTSTVLLLVLLLVLLAEIKLGKEKFKMGSILSTDISFENSYFYGRKREYKGNIRRVDELNYLLKSLEKRDSINFGTLANSAKNRTTNYGDVFKPKRPLAPVSLYFLAQLKGVDLEVFSNKELFALGVFTDNIEYIFTPDRRQLFSYISRQREIVDYLSVNLSLHKRYSASLRDGVLLFKGNPGVKLRLKESCRSFIVLNTYVYKLFFHYKQLNNTSTLCNFLLSLAASKNYFSISIDDKDLADKECTCMQCSQCVEEYVNKIIFMSDDLLGLDSFLMPTGVFSDSSTEISLLGDIYDFEVFSYNNNKRALNYLGEPKHKQNMWSYGNTYLAHENLLRIMFA